MLLTAFVLGLAGSFHCAGMCSPLAFAVTNLKKSLFLNRLVYNSGRIFTYGVLGAVVSSIGVALPLEEFQNVLSISLGGLLLVAGIFGVGRIKFPFATRQIARFTNFLKSQLSKILAKRNHFSVLLLGALNGLLPCGLIFIALTYCLILPESLDGFNFMIAFGAGTLPVMLGLISVFQFLINKFKISFQRVTTVMLIVSGVILIGRATLTELHKHSTALNTKGVEECR